MSDKDINNFTSSTIYTINKRRLNLSSIDWVKWGIPVAFLAMCIFFSISSPRFLRMSNFINVAKQSSSLAVMSWGVTLIIISAGIDLSVGSVVALVSVISAMLLKDFGLGFALLGGVMVSVIIGLIDGIIVSKLKLPAFIVTLGMMSIARGSALTITGGIPVFGLESNTFKWIGQGDILGIPFMLLVAIATGVITYLLLNKTKFGLYIYSIGGNEEASIYSGIPVEKIKILIYLYSGLLVGIAGILLTSRVNSGQPLMGSGMELEAIASVIIGGTSLFGGKGSIEGTFFGVILISILHNGLNLLGISTFIQQVIVGIVIILSVLTSVIRFKSKR